MSISFFKLISVVSLFILMPSVIRLQVAAAQGAAQDGNAPVALSSISGPILGMVFDVTRGEIRPILGIPGAATLGEALVLGNLFSRAWVSPKQDYVLGEIKDNGRLLLITFDRGSILIRSLKGALSSADRISLSSTGTSAAIYNERVRSLQFVTGLPHRPSVSQMDVSALSAKLTAMAVSDDGTAVLMGVSESKSGSVVLVRREGESRVINLVGQASAISFFRDSEDALIADRQNNAILLVRDVKGAAVITHLAGEREGVAKPIAVEASDDHRHVFVANAGSRNILALDLESGKLSRLGCNCTPSGLFRLAGNSVFRLTDISEAPLQLLDVGAGEPRLLFVPAGPRNVVPPSLPERGHANPLRIRGGRE